MQRTKKPFYPDAAQLALWPKISGNDINGLGRAEVARPTPIYWHDPDKTPHGPLQRWFYARTGNEPALVEARAYRQQMLDMPIGPLASECTIKTPREWSDQIKNFALAAGADLVGITQMRPEWVFEGYTVTQRWIVMLGVAHDFDKMKTAPSVSASAEVTRQYARGIQVSKKLASWIRGQGHEAIPHGGPMAGPLVLIPPALACGFGELGKHGSIINRQFGSSFRLAAVLVDLPLIADTVDQFGIDDYCLNCRACTNACPPDAIVDNKQLVRGAEKWYVDFDKCLPYFNENAGCAICISICPWSKPGVATKLLAKMARNEGTS